MSPSSREIVGRFSLLGALAILALPVARAQAEPEIVRVVRGADGNPGAFEVDDLSAPQIAAISGKPSIAESASRFFKVYVLDESQEKQQPAMLGTYTLKGETLRFTPRFPLLPGLQYRAVFDPAGAGAALETDKELADGSEKLVTDVLVVQPRKEETTVAHVYPSASKLPENLLRFYLHFSAPMSRGFAHKNVRLLDSKGQAVELPFLELDEELWDASGQRLTLLIDPGRIKRGVKPLEDLGPALVAGGKCTLVIDRGWQDAAGRPLAKEYRKVFQVEPPLREAIDPAKWVVKAPSTGTLDPLVVQVPRPLDRALFENKLTVTSNSRITGRISISDDERRWELHPEKPWELGLYQVVVDGVLEDVAGNRIGRPFEVEDFQLLEQADKQSQPKRVMIPFTIRRPSGILVGPK